MHLEAIKKSLPENFLVEWKEHIKESPIRIKQKKKKDASAVAAKWTDVITKVTGQQLGRFIKESNYNWFLSEEEPEDPG